MRNLIFTLALMFIGHLSFAQSSYECGGIKLTVLSVTSSEVRVEVDATNYNHQLNPPSAGAYQGMTLENGVCTSCQPVGGNRADKAVWTIQNQAGPTKLTFTRFTGSCNGESFTIDQPSTECGGIKLTVISVDTSGIQVAVNTENYNHQLNPPSAPTYRGFSLENGVCEGCNPAGGNHPDNQIWNIQNLPGTTKLIFSSMTGPVCSGREFVLD